MTAVPARTPASRVDTVRVRPAEPGDAAAVAAILHEAARWLSGRGIPLWRDDEIRPEEIAADVAAGLYVLAETRGHAAGTLRFQLADPEIWPDLSDDDSAFVHRLAVRREFGGSGVSSALLAWAVERARALGRRWLRLDCEAHRPKLRAFYERHGFVHHSDHTYRDFPTLARYQIRVDGG